MLMEQILSSRNTDSVTIFKQVGPLRLLYAALVAFCLLMVFLPDGDDTGWYVLSNHVAPVLVILNIWILLFDLLMASILMSQKDGQERLRYRHILLWDGFLLVALFTSREQGLSNVTGIVNTPIDIGLPADAIDLAFISDTYHHFEYPQQTLASIHQALRSEGRVIIIDFRRDPRISSNWVMGHVRGNKAQVIQEMQVAGFRLVDDKPLMRTNYFLEFVKSGKI